MISSFAKTAAALAAAVLLSMAVVPEASAGSVSCGDEVCSGGEDCNNCPQDCPGCCSNGDIEFGEGCDDGNLGDNDGCNSFCLVENGTTCGTSGPGLTGDSSCESGVCDETQSVDGVCEAANVCGNGTLDSNEGCDDGGEISLDGCSSNCFVENGYPCNSDVSGFTGDQSCASGLCDETEGGGLCEPLDTCGNGTLETAEGCDDGNVVTGDGCDENCFIEDPFPCNDDSNGITGDNSCASGICDEAEGPTGTCQAQNDCGNTVCEETNEETCANCEVDCGVCPSTTVTTSTTTSTSTTTTSTTSTTSTTIPSSTTTTTSTTSTTSTTTSTTSSTTMPVVGACCFSTLCQTVEAGYCTGELQGTYQGDGTDCDDAGICSDCGNGCIEFSEQCDDAGTATGDGCDSNCQEEECWSCSSGQLTGETGPVACSGGGPSQCQEDLKCSICGDGVVELDEQCDPGKGSDPCCDDCQFVAAATSCADGNFCDGVETCDGSGNCNDGPDPTCDQLDTQCAEGYCDLKLDACAAETESKNDDPCEASGECVASGGTCQDGACVGAGSVLSPSCRWIIVGGTPTDDVRVRTGPGSTVDADMCGDTARIGGISSADIVAIATTGEGIRFYSHPSVDGDIVTGGATVRSNLYLTIPGTALKSVDTGMTVPKDPSGVVSTTGLHALVDVCADDQAILASATATLDAMPSDGTTPGLKVGVGSGATIDVTGLGVGVIDVDFLKVSHGATLTLKGNPTDVLMLRVNGGRLKIGYGANVVLDGLVASNVLIYADGPRCRVSPGVVGAGTMFCPDAGRFIIGAGVNWSGTFLGASREMRVRSNADLTHVPFTGF